MSPRRKDSRREVSTRVRANRNMRAAIVMFEAAQDCEARGDLSRAESLMRVAMSWLANHKYYAARLEEMRKRFDEYDRRENGSESPVK